MGRWNDETRRQVRRLRDATRRITGGDASQAMKWRRSTGAGEIRNASERKPDAFT
jgi:hypothetical protein